MEGLMALLLYQQIGFNSLKYEEKTEKSQPRAIAFFWFGPFVIGSAIVILILAVYGFYIIEYLA
jgi:hypothetical protein